MPSDGIEPATSSLLVTRSTIELRGPIRVMKSPLQTIFACWLLKWIFLFKLISVNKMAVRSEPICACNCGQGFGSDTRAERHNEFY